MASMPRWRRERSHARPTTSARAVETGNGKRRPHRSWKFWLRRLAEAAIIALAVVFVLRRVPELSDIGHLFAHVRWPWLVVGAVIETGSFLSLSFLQQRLLRSSGVDVRYRRVVPITLASNAVGSSIPAGALVAEGYAFQQYRRVGASPVGAAWIELAAGALEAAALSAVALAGALIVGHGLRAVLVPPLVVVFIGATAAAVLFQRTSLLARVTNSALAIAERHAPRSVQSRLRRAEESTADMAPLTPSASSWALGGAAALANWICDALVLATSSLAIGAGVPWRSLLIIYAGGQLLAELPITPGGLGIVEGGLVALLTRFHMSATSATAAVLAYRGLSLWVPILVGWIAAARLRRISLAAAREDTLSASPLRAGATIDERLGTDTCSTP